MVQGKNKLGYLRTRTFYTPERKYAYKYASITKWLRVEVGKHPQVILAMHFFLSWTRIMSVIG
jgi:hypothetical protein